MKNIWTRFHFGFPSRFTYFDLIFWFKGQTSRHAGSLCPFKWQSGPDSAQPSQEVCGPGHSAHASPWLGRAGDEALREGAGLPRGADWLTYQQLGPQRLWTLSFLCCETFNITVLAYVNNIMFLVMIVAANVPINGFTDIILKCMTFRCIRRSSCHSWKKCWSCCVSAMQEAEELGCSIFVHPWDMQTDGRMAKYWLPWLVGEGKEME